MKRNDTFSNKTLVLMTVMLFIASAFLPAIGSQITRLNPLSTVLSTDQSKQTPPIGAEERNDIATDSKTNIIETKEISNNPAAPLDRGDDPWWNTNWGCRKMITIDYTKVASSQVNFPVVVNLTDNDLKTKAQSNGYDIVFTNKTGTKLNHEIELYTSSSGRLIAWVNVTALSSTANTILYMYYNNPSSGNQQNPSGVWDTNYVMVQHLKETSGTLYDSTVYDNDGTNYGSTQGAVGKIDGADDFDGINDYVDCGNGNSLSVTSKLTAEAWIKWDNRVGNDAIVNKGSSWALGFWSTGNKAEQLIWGTSWKRATGSTILSYGSWYYLTGTFNRSLTDGKNIKIYVNGLLDGYGAMTNNASANTDKVVIGKWSNAAADYFDGIIDELRISKTDRSPGWIKTCYNNQINPSSFYSFGLEEFYAPDEPVVSNEYPVDESTDVELNPTLSIDVVDHQGDTVTVYFMSNTSGSWTQIGTEQSGGNNTYTQATTNMNDYNKIYWWSVNVTDDTHWTNRTNRFTTELETGKWWNTNWLYRKQITIDHNKVYSGSPLTFFPILIDITDTNLKTKAQTDGDDIVFTDDYGTKLNHEIEYYDSGSGRLIAWVNVASLSDTVDTVLFMYYGNSGCSSQENIVGVWDSNYIMVQHLNETSGTLYDSTVYGNDGTPKNGLTQGATGQIDGADDFDGTNDYINVPYNSSLGMGDEDQITVEAWFNPDNLGIQEALVEHYDWQAGKGSFIFRKNNQKLQFGIVQGASWSWAEKDNIFVNTDTTYHCVGTYDGSIIRLYANGKQVATTPLSGGMLDPTVSLAIGARGDDKSTLYANGIIDEVRLSNKKRSEGWINTTYINQHDPSGFYLVGDEELTDAPAVLYENPVNGAINVPLILSKLNFTLTDFQGNMMSYTVVTVPNIGSGDGHFKVNGTYNISVSGLSYSTKYTWYVNVTDGAFWTNKTFSFTTVSDEPVVSDEHPIDDSVNQPLMPVLSIHVEDRQGDDMNVLFRTNASGSWVTIGVNSSVGNGTYYCDNTNVMSSHSALYYWSVNVTDPSGSGKWVNNSYHFTTKQKVTGPYAMFPELGDEFVAIEYSGSCWDAVGHGPHTLDVLTLNKNGHKYWGYYGCRNDASGVGVAYSDDLLTWTRYSCSSPLISGVRWPTVGIQNDTIHMFYYRGSGMYRATSPITDGINFTEVETVVSGTAVTPFLFKNPVDDEWWLFWVGPTSTYNARHARDIRDLDTAATIVVRVETSISAWAPSVFYWNNTYYFTEESEPGGVWVERAFYNSTLGPNCFNNAAECLNSPILTDEAACGMAHIEGDQLYYYWSYKFNDGSDLWNVKGAKSVESCETSPIITGVSPLNGAVDQSVSPVLSVSVKDLQHDPMNILFKSNASGTWKTIGSNISVGDGTYRCRNTSDMNGYGVTYYWNVHVIDPLGSGSWTNHTYHFTTASPSPPVVSNPIPANGSTHQSLNPLLSITVTDINGDNLDITFKSNASGSWTTIGTNTSVYDGTYTCDNTADMNNNNKIYYWSVHVTDGNYWTNKSYHFTTEPALGEWWNTNWLYRKQITIDHNKVYGESPLTFFPILIDITDTNLTTKAQPDADDIVFTDEYSIKLNHEIEFYNNVSGHLIAWVNVTSLSDTTDIVLYMYYGNSSCSSQENIPGVWDSNYVMVQHLNETSAIQYDSTSYNNHGTPTGGVTQGSIGKVDGCDDFDGSNDYVNVPDSNSLTPGTKLTLSAWVNVDNFPTVGTYKFAQVIGKWRQTVDDEYFFDINQTGQLVFCWHTTGSNTWGNPSYNLKGSTGNINTHVWTFIVAVRDGTNVRFYINGNLDTAFSGVVDSNPFRNGVNPVRIGAETTTATPRFLNGLIDEARISNVARGSGWIKTCYNNQNSPNTFYSVGAEEEQISEKEYIITLQDGWNIISAQCYDSISKTNITVRNNSIDRTWAQAVDNGTILGFIYNYDRATQSYGLNNSLEPGYGYWVWAYYDCDLIVSGIENKDSFITLLQQNWNIMGLPYNISVAKENLIINYSGVDYTWQQAIDNDIILGFVYDWDRNTQNYILSDDLDPGFGYWMYAFHDCILKKEVN